MTIETLQRVGEKLNWAGADGRYDVPVRELAALITEPGSRGGRGGGEPDAARAVIGHLARAGVLAPAPAPPDRAVGRMTGGFDRRAAALCMSSAREAENVRWTQYRAIWAFVEGSRCRREAMLAHFGDPRRGPAEVPCCDVCAPDLAPAPMRGAPASASRSRSGARTGGARVGSRAAAAPLGGVERKHLDEAILDVVVSARPPVGRTRAVEILRGGRSKVVAQYAYDTLAGYGRFAHLRSEEVLGRVDGLLDDGRLHSSGGRFPKLRGA